MTDAGREGAPLCPNRALTSCFNCSEVGVGGFAPSWRSFPKTPVPLGEPKSRGPVSLSQSLRQSPRLPEAPSRCPRPLSGRTGWQPQPQSGHKGPTWVPCPEGPAGRFPGLAPPRRVEEWAPLGAALSGHSPGRSQLRAGAEAEEEAIVGTLGMTRWGSAFFPPREQLISR